MSERGTRRRWGCAGCAVLGILGLAALTCVGVGVGTPVAIRGQAALRERVDRHDAAPPGRWVHADDVELHVLEAGPDDGPPVLLVHGSGAWGGAWAKTSVALAAAGFRVIAVDLPPFGYSERPASGDYTTEAQARRLSGLLDALDLDGVGLVGHSFGGLATVETALGSSRVGRLVLIDVALGLSSDPREPSALLSVAPLRETLVAGTFTNPWFIPHGVRSFVHDPADATREVVEIYRRPLVVEGTTAAIGTWVPELIAPTSSPAAADRASYGRITAPTLVIWGREDTATPLAQGEELRALVPGARLEVLDGVAHIPQIEDPEAVNALLIAFLR